MVPGDSGEDHVLPSNHHRAVWRGPQLHQLNQIYTREQLCALLYARDGKILLINHILFHGKLLRFRDIHNLLNILSSNYINIFYKIFVL